MNKDIIIGNWVLDPSDVKSFHTYGDISIEFKNNGELIYKIHSKGKDEIINMTYEIKEDVLITDQQSFPHKEETEFKITFEDKLELFFSGVKSIYIRKFD